MPNCKTQMRHFGWFSNTVVGLYLSCIANFKFIAQVNGLFMIHCLGQKFEKKANWKGLVKLYKSCQSIGVKSKNPWSACITQCSANASPVQAKSHNCLKTQSFFSGRLPFYYFSWYAQLLWHLMKIKMLC